MVEALSPLAWLASAFVAVSRLTQCIILYMHRSMSAAPALVVEDITHHSHVLLLVHGACSRKRTREFVHHIVEDEAEGQLEKKDDRREDRQQREESGEVEDNQTHNMSAWR